jgi:hypothetical protein
MFFEREAADFGNAMGAPRRDSKFIIAPSLPGRLLFGSDLNAAGEATGRIAGFVTLCLAAGCRPRAGASGRHQAIVPLVALTWLAAVFLVVTGLIGATVGLLLWLAAALHLILAVLLTWTWERAPRDVIA